MVKTHGGPDEQGIPSYDFSSNANACGPCPQALNALHHADPRHYPDPAYTRLRAALADWHGVAPVRVLLAASASEFIYRITACAVRLGVRCAHWPQPGYGDYALAAQAWGLKPVQPGERPGLFWACEPSSPLGQVQPCPLPDAATLFTVLDRAYEPLRLSGQPSFGAAVLERVWQLWSPNKALGLTGVRAAYCIAPLHAEETAAQLDQLCASWPLGAHGEALLQAWVTPAVQQWLADSRDTLCEWKTQQLALCAELGWEVAPSVANFFCVRPDRALDVQRLRAAGVKLRDATSFGLPGWWRMRVHTPQAQQVLRDLHADTDQA